MKAYSKPRATACWCLARTGAYDATAPWRASFLPLRHREAHKEWWRSSLAATSGCGGCRHGQLLWGGRCRRSTTIKTETPAGNEGASAGEETAVSREQRYLQLELSSGQVMSVCISRPCGLEHLEPRPVLALWRCSTTSQSSCGERVRRDFVANVACRTSCARRSQPFRDMPKPSSALMPRPNAVALARSS